MIVRSEGAAGGFFAGVSRREQHIRADAAHWGGAHAISIVLSFKTKHVLAVPVNCLNNIGPRPLDEGACCGREIEKETSVQAY
jgi:hypothetical protein